MVLSTAGWNPDIVLPTLQTQLTAGTHAMGQTMAAMLTQNDHLSGMPRVFLTLSTMAQATSGGSGAARRRGTRRQAACASTGHFKGGGG